jgi:hypothetical protein
LECEMENKRQQCQGTMVSGGTLRAEHQQIKMEALYQCFSFQHFEFPTAGCYL